MKIDAIIQRLNAIRAKHGNVECESDCPHCGQSFFVGQVAIAPETVRLNQAAHETKGSK